MVLCTIIKHKGSTPREAGTRMVLRENGTTIGTIGGGLLESKAIEIGKGLFEKKIATVLNFDMTDQYVESEKMICGGKLSVLIEFVWPNEINKELFKAIAELKDNTRELVFVLQLKNLEGDEIAITRGLIEGESVILGDFHGDKDLVHRIQSTIPDSRHASQMVIEEDRFWVEPLLFPKKLMLFGAGHVSRATARLADLVGFKVIVIDDRNELLTEEYFDPSVQRTPIDSFSDCVQSLNIDRDCFIVILTSGHHYDKSVLSQALGTDACYIGMIGSRRKRDTIFKSLLEEKFTEEQLENVFSPIGLNIGAATPEEIAISIVAQLIEIRSKLDA